ncbi:MAG: leucine-rich repeat domain-containing protein, partial [Holosporales bacterium]|nr:leucine-rich repeat domain-containing protein [Holosporales bacterium]
MNFGVIIMPQRRAFTPSVHTSGLSSGIQPGLSSGIHPRLSSGLHPGLSSGLHSGLSSGIQPGLSSGIQPSLSSGLHPGLFSGIQPGHSSGIPSGLPSATPDARPRLSRQHLLFTVLAFAAIPLLHPAAPPPASPYEKMTTAIRGTVSRLQTSLTLGNVVSARQRKHFIQQLRQLSAQCNSANNYAAEHAHQQALHVSDEQTLADSLGRPALDEQYPDGFKFFADFARVTEVFKELIYWPQDMSYDFNSIAIVFDQQSLQQEMIDRLDSIKTLILVKNYNIPELDLPNRHNIEKLVMLDGEMDAPLRDAVVAKLQYQHEYQKKLKYVEISKWGTPTLDVSFFQSKFTHFIGFEDVTSIDVKYAFCYNTRLATVSLPNLESITKSECFYHCDALASISLPALTSLSGGSCFSSCSNLTLISLPALTSLSVGGFSSCSNLTSISLPALTSITGGDCFVSSNALTSITFSDQITTVGNDVFRYCPASLTTLHLVGQLNTDGNAINGIVSSCGKLNAATYKMPVADFTFSIGESVLAAVAGPDLLAYINTTLSVRLDEVPLLASIPAGKRIFDLGDTLIDPNDLDVEASSLFGSIKMCGASFSINDLSHVMCLNNQSAISADAISKLASTTTLFLIKNYKPTGLNLNVASLPILKNLIMLDGKMDDGLRASVTTFAGNSTTLQYLMISRWGLPEFDTRATKTNLTHFAGFEDIPCLTAKEAFYSCKTLTAVFVPNVITIPASSANWFNSWFADCAALTSLSMPDLTTISENDCFSHNNLLMEVSFPKLNIITSEANNCFSYCTNLTSISWDKLTSIEGNDCFSYCTSLVSVSLPALTSITGPNCFYDCRALAAVSLPALTSIGSCCFSYCESLTSISLPVLTSITEDRCFADCTSLTSISLPALTSITGPFSFINCSALTSISLPALTSITGDVCIAECPSLISISLPALTSFTGDTCFMECPSLTSVSLPALASVTGIGLFIYCGALTSVPLPALTQIIGMGAFAFCDALTSVAFSDQITAVGNEAFVYCSESLTELHLVGQPDADGNAINGIVSSCAHLNAAEYKMSVTAFTFSIGERILAQLSAPELTTYINDVFSIPLASVPFVAAAPASQRIFDLGDLQNYEFPAIADDSLFGTIRIGGVSYSVRDFSNSLYLYNQYSISDSTISRLSAITTLVIISNYAVDGLDWGALTSLQKLVMRDGAMNDALRASVVALANEEPKSLREVELSHWGAPTLEVSFQGANLTHFIGFEDVTDIAAGQCFASCGALTSVSLPALTSISGHYCFYGCSALASISLPALTELRSCMCFAGCSSLTYVLFPALTYIETSELFEDCDVLTSVAFSDQITYFDDNVFNCSSESLTELQLIGQPDADGNAINGIVSSCAHINAASEKMPIARFTFSIGERLLAQLSGAELTTYINTALSIPRTSVPFVASLPAEQRVFDLGDIENYEFPAIIDDGLFGVIKIRGVEYSVGDFSNCLYLYDQASISENTISRLSSFTTLIMIKNYAVDGLSWSAITNVAKLVMRDGAMSDALRDNVSSLAKNAPKNLKYLELSHWGIPTLDKSFEQSNLTHVIGFADVTSITAGYCFSQTPLVSISFPALTSVTGDDCFSGCSSLTSISLPALISLSGWYCFHYCSALTLISLPVLAILGGSGDFDGCDSLTSVAFSDQITYVSYAQFAGCYATDLCLVGQPDADGNAINGIVSSCGHLNAAGHRMSVAHFTFSIGERILAQLSTAELATYINAALSIPRTSVPFVASLPATNRIFDLGDMQTYEFPTIIDDGLFGTIRICGVEYPASELSSSLYLYNETSIPASTISRLGAITKLIVIDNYAVEGLNWGALTSLQTLVMRGGEMSDALRASVANLVNNPPKLKYLELSHWGTPTLNVSFQGSNLTHFIGFADVTNITADSCFSSCRALTSVSLPAITSITGYCFASCDSLTSISLPALTSTTENCFSSCPALTSVSLPALTSIPQPDCFAYCNALTSISLPALTSIAGSSCFDYCNALTSVSLPALTSITGPSCFFNCSVLASITFSDQITEVGNQAFRYCLLTALQLVGQPNAGGNAVNGIVSSCGHLNAAQYKMPVATFTFSIGESILAQLSGAALVAYVNDVLSIPLVSVPFVANVAADKRVFDLGDIQLDTLPTIIEDGLFGVVKMGGVSYSVDDFSNRLYLYNQASIPAETISRLGSITLLTII